MLKPQNKNFIQNKGSSGSITKFRSSCQWRIQDFPRGGRRTLGGRAWTPEAVKFQNFFMSKRKNLDP